MEDVPEWFHGAQLNFAENLLRYDDDKVALYTAGTKPKFSLFSHHESHSRFLGHLITQNWPMAASPPILD